MDMVNFGALETVPEKYRHRKLHVHNSQITLLRTTVEENRKIGQWMANKLNRFAGVCRKADRGIPSAGETVNKFVSSNSFNGNTAGDCFLCGKSFNGR